MNSTPNFRYSAALLFTGALLTTVYPSDRPAAGFEALLKSRGIGAIFLPKMAPQLAKHTADNAVRRIAYVSIESGGVNDSSQPGMKMFFTYDPQDRISRLSMKIDGQDQRSMIYKVHYGESNRQITEYSYFEDSGSIPDTADWEATFFHFGTGRASISYIDYSLILTRAPFFFTLSTAPAPAIDSFFYRTRVTDTATGSKAAWGDPLKQVLKHQNGSITLENMMRDSAGGYSVTSTNQYLLTLNPNGTIDSIKCFEHVDSASIPPLSGIITHTYDASGRLVAVKDTNCSQSSWTLNKRTVLRFEYNSDGTLASIHERTHWKNDPENDPLFDFLFTFHYADAPIIKARHPSVRQSGNGISVCYKGAALQITSENGDAVRCITMFDLAGKVIDTFRPIPGSVGTVPVCTFIQRNENMLQIIRVETDRAMATFRLNGASGGAW